MENFSQNLAAEHAHCDAYFAAAEDAAARLDWSRCQSAFSAFRTATETHFQAEERVLFPALERISGTDAGPTGVMRDEHAQLRAVFGEMAAALTRQDQDAYLGLSDTLVILLQQHNHKEEQILYPMADRLLAGERPQLLRRMGAARAGRGVPA